MAFDPNAAAEPGSGIFGLETTPEESGVVLIPVPWDATTSYRAGASQGPLAILEASKQVDLFDLETGKPYEAGVAMLPIDDEMRGWNSRAREQAERVIEVGGRVHGEPDLMQALQVVNAISERVNLRVTQLAEEWLGRGKIVGVVGGDHAAPFGLMAAVAAKRPGVGILHIDAHADLRVAYEGFVWSHASIMYNVLKLLPGVSKLVQVGLRDVCEAEMELVAASAGRVVAHPSPALALARFQGETWAKQARRIVGDLPPEVYVSFDIDGLDPVLCPNTGTPVPGGLSFEEASYLIGEVVRSGRKIVGFDLNEVAPGDDEWDANVGARMLYKLVGWTLRSGFRWPASTSAG